MYSTKKIADFFENFFVYNSRIIDDSTFNISSVLLLLCCVKIEEIMKEILKGDGEFNAAKDENLRVVTREAKLIGRKKQLLPFLDESVQTSWFLRFASFFCLGVVWFPWKFFILTSFLLGLWSWTAWNFFWLYGQSI